jgi:hypothetical protein
MSTHNRNILTICIALAGLLLAGLFLGDSRADFNRDSVVSSTDFNLLKGTFGQGGASLTCP